MLTEMRDTVPLVMKGDGDRSRRTRPRRTGSTAIDKIKEAADSGQIRRFTGNDYTERPDQRRRRRGDRLVGRRVQLQADNPNIEFRMPDEGCMLWSDNMVIPVGAPNPTAAEAFMNFVYDPKNQAQIAEYVNYVTPVDGRARRSSQKKDPELANNQLIFPTSSSRRTARLRPIRPERRGAARSTQAFQAVVTG